MNDTWNAAAATWSTRSTVEAAGILKDCPGGSGGSGGGGSGGGSGGGGSGGGGSGGGGSGGGSGGGGGCCTAPVCHCDHAAGTRHDTCGCGHAHTHECHDHPEDRGPGRGCHCHEHAGGGCHHHDHDRACRDAPGAPAGATGTGTYGGATTIGWRNPNRPGRICGTSTGQVPGGLLDPCDFGTPPWNTWPGQRGDLYLPFLFLRANAGDLGARPVVGPFWESPDVLLLAGVDPSTAPAVPPDLGQTALAGQPNTVYAHVWNFGLAQAPNVVVEFYWCDPRLGINPDGVHLIGYGEVSLGARGSGKSHAIVKCPSAWVPTFLNGGHECLLVRAWDITSDGLGTPPWDAALNRHIGQRNIHVIAAGAGPHALTAGSPLLLPVPAAPLTLKVGPLYGEPAVVSVGRVAPYEMPWLQQRTGTRGLFPAQAAPTGAVLLSPPTAIGGGPTAGNGDADHQHVIGDDQQLDFTTGDLAPAPGQAHVYRVTAAQQGQVFGGYTVVLLG